MCHDQCIADPECHIIYRAVGCVKLAWSCSSDWLPWTSNKHFLNLSHHFIWHWKLPCTFLSTILPVSMNLSYYFFNFFIAGHLSGTLNSNYNAVTKLQFWKLIYTINTMNFICLVLKPVNWLNTNPLSYCIW